MKTHRTHPADRPSPNITVLAAVALIAVVAIGLYVVVNWGAVFGFARYLSLAYGGWG